MLQMFHLNIFKSISGVAHVAMAIHACFACFACFVCFRHMLQEFHLDVSKVDLGEVHAIAASVPPCRHGSPCALASATAAACMQAHEMERAWGGPRACMTPHGLRSRMGACTRELGVSRAGTGAPSDASTPSDRTSGR
jgi:hypothetical protein